MEENESPNCVICLDSFSSENPLYLLPCGCKNAWLHLECEGNYLVFNQHEPIRCPLCRRIIFLHTNYCFWPSAGKIQSMFWITIIGSLAELPFHYLLFLETFLILLLPIFLKTNKTFDFFIGHVYLKQLLFYTLFLFELFFSYNFKNFILMISHAHCIILVLIQLSTFDLSNRNNYLEPFAISREIVHLKKLS